MAFRLVSLSAALVLALPVWSLPSPEALERRQTCQDQSCVIAAISGSSGQAFTAGEAPPVGGTEAGDCCVIHYNPAVANALYADVAGLKAYCAANPYQAKREASPELVEDVQRRASCLPYTAIFARGTSESGTLGEIVGPELALGLEEHAPFQWSVQGVSYDASEFGDDCLGLPGGAAGTQLLESIASSCPKTKIVMSGYSQGAMVIHNAIAYASKAAAARVLGVVVFGDPFNGAPIKGYSGPIKTYCASGDLVCDGLDNITLAHLSYGIDTPAAAAYLQSLV